MTTMLKTLLATSAALVAVAAGGASAQTIAIASPADAILNAKAFGTANQTISTQYKAQLDQAAAKQTALNTQLKAILDTNKDGTVSNDEYAAGQNATSAIGQRVKAAESAAQPELDRLRNPAILAQAYALEQVGLKYDPALQAVARQKNASVVLAPNAVQFGGTDITRDVTAEIDRTAPTVASTPPANWQPSQDTLQLLQQYRQAVYLQQVRASQQGPAAGTTTPPATTTPARNQPQGR